MLPIHMKLLFQFVKVLLSICLLQGLIANATTEDQVKTLFENLQIQQTLTTHYVGVNHSMIEKRTPKQSTQKQELLNNFQAYIDRKLAWSNIGPDLINFYSQILNEQDIEALNNFLKSPAGKIYKDQYQTTSVVNKLMLDQYGTELVEGFFANPNKPLQKVSLTKPSEKQAYELLSVLMCDARKEDFDNNQKATVNIIEGSINNKKQIQNFTDAYSFDQANMRSAKLLAEKIPAENMKTLLLAVKDKKLESSLKKMDFANAVVSLYLQEVFLTDDEFKGLIGKSLSLPN